MPFRAVSGVNSRTIAAVLLDDLSVIEGGTSVHGLPTVVASKRVGDVVYRGVFEVRLGKKNRALSLTSLVVKIAGGS